MIIFSWACRGSTFDFLSLFGYFQSDPRQSTCRSSQNQEIGVNQSYGRNSCLFFHFIRFKFIIRNGNTLCGNIKRLKKIQILVRVHLNVPKVLKMF